MGKPTNTDDHLNASRATLAETRAGIQDFNPQALSSYTQHYPQVGAEISASLDTAYPHIRRKRIVEHLPDALNSEKIDRLLEKLLTEEE